jgi:hypothetical protein
MVIVTCFAFGAWDINLSRTSADSPLSMPISIGEVSPAAPEAVELIGELDAHLMAHPYPPQSRHAFSVEKLLREGVVFFVTHDEGSLAGCGGIKIVEGAYGEVKRMFAAGISRQGIGEGDARASRGVCARSAARSFATRNGDL